jgi:uncharacterized protein with NAD-binding domain and iron-sulfur cluster
MSPLSPADVSVAVVGGGIGGLSAAQELAERGVSVSVYEANPRFGGKARSVPVSPAENALHGEHGFRFFPGFYRHVVDTMARIPTPDGSVADRLVETEETLIARVSGAEARPETRSPRTPGEWLRALRPRVAQDLAPGEFRFFASRLLYLLTACDARRETELDRVSWWRFIEADRHSETYRNRLAHATQALVALRPEVGSARTIGTIYTQLLGGQLDPTVPTERVLDGPTSEAWIDPWVSYLDSLGVALHPGTPARTLRSDGARVSGVELASGEVVEADYYVLAVPVEVAPRLLPAELKRADPQLAHIERLETAWMNGIQFFLSEDVPLVRGHGVYQDAPWALTSVSQRQFWSRFEPGEKVPAGVEGVLSVIVSDWDTPGIRYDKPARECTREEIKEEVWAQLKAHLNRREDRLRDDMVVDWFLDPAIVEGDGGVENREPLLINTVGSLRNRPDAATRIPNLTLAADYVRTNTDLACMESANEAARRAVNAVVERSGVRADPCAVWELREPAVFAPLKKGDELRYRLGLPHPAAVGDSLRETVRNLRV